VAEGKDAKFTPSMVFTVDTPPFQSFLLDRVLGGMVNADAKRVQEGELADGEALDYDVTEDNYRITRIDIYNYGGERRLREINSSLRWTFEKMLDKARQEEPIQEKSEKATPQPQEPEEEPSFKRASGETVMGPEELKARAAVEGLTGCDQLNYEVMDGALWVSPTKFLGDAWNPINDALKQLGARWISVNPSHWMIPVKKSKPSSKPVGEQPPEVEKIIKQIQANQNVSRAAILDKIDEEIAKAAGLLTKEAAAYVVASEYLFTGLSIESVENHLTELHGDTAMERLAVTENSTFIMVEPYQSLTQAEKAEFGKTLKGLGAKERGDEEGWYIKKPKGDK